MDPAPEKYRPGSDTALAELVEQNPFAWVVSAGGGFSATPLPVRPRLDSQGRLVALAGHFARSNPHLERLRSDPRALFLFMGPHAYVSASWLSDRSQAPTWNYASAAFECGVELTEDPAEIDALLRDLIDSMEHGRPDAWSPEEMGERYARLSRGVVGFTAPIRAARPAFKLGQDESEGQFDEIVSALESEAPQTAKLMRDFRPLQSGNS
ncbi:FMN-binding negative transcriptional regulator [Glycocaulis profundi]|nr:FMN-binding negative transcriptional regulator [Glycocaulis profundi]